MGRPTRADLDLRYGFDSILVRFPPPGWNPTGRPPSFDHTMVKAPDPIRTPKLSTIGPAQYCGGGPRGNRRCRMFLPFWNRIPRNFNPP